MNYEKEYYDLLGKYKYLKMQVRSMRNAQNTYFATRHKTDLSIAKSWEYKVDKELNEKSNNQLNLFEK